MRHRFPLNAATAALFTALLALGQTASAASEADVPPTEKLLLLIGMDQAVGTMRAQISQLVQAQVAQFSTTPEQQDLVVEYLLRIDALIEEELAWDDVRTAVVAAWDAQFTDAEIAAMVEFFDSPVGRRYVESIPTLQRQTLEIVQGHAEPTLIPQIESLVQEMRLRMAPPDGDGAATHSP